ncbi:hypothetical protein M431DRAFT_288042 [Trichoderma harzianum CBS 226.95]|uniref:Uncharacterized protein n=1 Tax=Trichoderma harzianum CBS 226.95 TaxID=983964 RepID=A0A2T4AP41_TRIHA|nr:hypothetical protein M431DRAFT_288042 [Trichoderma harzianum CBS 226.95]PTB58845.1 hypothetical protein M431DRAFT_288042 [Trichoderma harzianum CBS 226.95]
MGISRYSSCHAVVQPLWTEQTARSPKLPRTKQASSNNIFFLFRLCSSVLILCILKALVYILTSLGSRCISHSSIYHRQTKLRHVTIS